LPQHALHQVTFYLIRRFVEEDLRYALRRGTERSRDLRSARTESITAAAHNSPRKNMGVLLPPRTNIVER
jgi:hypothetical protein